jgi:protein TonB
VLLAGVGALGYHKLQPKTIAPTKSVAAPQLTTTTMNAAQPSTGSTTATASAPVATTAAAAPAPSANSGQERPARSQSDMMNHQLNAPSRIPNDLRMLGGKEPPPSSGFGGSGMEGMSGGAGNVFGQNGTKVKVEASRRMSISAGVAGGLLIQKTAPVYPQLAKEARISGTVVIQATISKYGTIQNPRVVSGSTMLRQAALDAVKSWRYKPYVLDGEPVEVETTVSVSFNLGG